MVKRSVRFGHFGDRLVQWSARASRPIRVAKGDINEIIEGEGPFEAVKSAMETAESPDERGWRILWLAFEHDHAAVGRVIGLGDLVEVIERTEVKDRVIATARVVTAMYGMTSPTRYGHLRMGAPSPRPSRRSIRQGGHDLLSESRKELHLRSVPQRLPSAEFEYTFEAPIPTLVPTTRRNGPSRAGRASTESQVERHLVNPVAPGERLFMPYTIFETTSAIQRLIISRATSGVHIN